MRSKADLLTGVVVKESAAFELTGLPTIWQTWVQSLGWEDLL